LRPALERQGPRRARASAELRAARAAVFVRAEVAVRGLPAAGRARVLPSLEREASPAGGLHAVRLDAGEPHPPAVGDGGPDLDLQLRRRSGGARSLDDLVRVLFEKHRLPPGLPEDGVETAAIELLGGESGLHDWFQRAVHSTQELQLEEAMAGAGLKAVQHAAKNGDDKGGAAQEPPDP